MKILSLFDGISCARVALERAGIPVEAYYASEIDKYAMQVSAKNWPEIVQVGNVVDLDTKQFKGIDLLIGGSPCQDLSIAKKDRKGLDGDRSGLFWEYVRILNEVKPKYFVLENVASMPKEATALITETLGVEPIMIDAALVSAQRRKRLFWVGKRVGDKYQTVPVQLPEDSGILLKDILEDGDGVALTERRTEEARRLRSEHMKKTGKDFSPRRAKELVAREDGKANCITTGVTKEMLVMKEKSNTIRTSGRGSGYGDKHNWDMVTETRKLTPTECERLQSLPDGYTEGVSNTQRYKALGNAFNVEVVAHILTSGLCK